MSVENIDLLKKIINNSINKFINDKIDGKEDLFLNKTYDNMNSYSYKDYYNTNNLDNLELKKIATNFITNKYFQNSDSLENFAIFCYDIFSYSISLYCQNIINVYKNLKPDNIENKIKIYLKGGNVLNAIFFKNVEYLNIDLKNKIVDKFSDFFNPSDFDFQIILEKNLSKKNELNDELYDKIYSDLSHLIFYILNDIREYFQRFSMDIFD